MRNQEWASSGLTGTLPRPRTRSERFMTGKIDEERFWSRGEIVLIEYPGASSLRDEREGIRILSTGSMDKQKAFREVTRRMRRSDHNHRPLTGMQ